LEYRAEGCSEGDGFLFPYRNSGEGSSVVPYVVGWGVRMIRVANRRILFL
jgi:hypothetical protein